MPIGARSRDRRMKSLRPGEMLREEFLMPRGLSAYALAIYVPATRILEIVHKRRRVTAGTALRLSQHFGMAAEFWRNVQKKYELDVARDGLEVTVLREMRSAPRNEKAGALCAV